MKKPTSRFLKHGLVLLLLGTQPVSAVPDQIDGEEFRKLRCPDSNPVYYMGKGKIFAFNSDVLKGNVFDLLGLEISGCIQDDSGKWLSVSREITLYLDPATGKVVHKWEHPVDKDEVSVMHNANPYQAFPLPSKVFVERSDNKIQVDLDVPKTRKNPVYGIPQFEDYIPYKTFNTFESYSFVYPDKDTGVDPTLTFFRVGPYLPWMRMGKEKGELVYRITATKIKEFKDLDPKLKEVIETRLPSYKKPPSKILVNANQANSWELFPVRFDAYLRGEIFPLREGDLN